MTTFLHTTTTFLQVSYPTPLLYSAIKHPFGLYERSYHLPSTRLRRRRRFGLPGGSGTGGAPAAAAESHRCWTAAGTYVRAGLYL